MKSIAGCALPIVRCLMEAERFVTQVDPGGFIELQWTLKDRKQMSFMKRFYIPLQKLAEKADFMKGKADRDPAVINSWLKEEGFDIRLKETAPRDDTFAIASILSILVNWAVPGTRTTINKDGKEYPAAKLEGINTWTDAYGRTLARIDTREGFKVWITPLTVESESDGNLHLLPLAEDILREMATYGDFHSIDYTHIVFPLVDLDVQPDISFLVGMDIDGWKVGESIQQARLQMDHIGALAESAAAMSFERLGKEHLLVIDQPFIVMFEWENTFVFAAHVCEDAWKDPKLHE